MKMKTLARVMLGMAAASPLLGYAQDNRGALEEIIVTAQKREEAIQDVPVAISAFSADNLESQGVNSLLDLQTGKVPSLAVMSFAGRPGLLTMSIRGVSEADATQLAIERPLALYVDGVYMSRTNMQDTELLTLERIEVLRGPQGTLFGRNAEGGAVSIITQKPRGEFAIRQELEASTIDDNRAKTVLDLPAVGGLASRLVYVKHHNAGWTGNPDPQTEDFGYSDKDGYRLALQYQGIDDLLVDYAYDNSQVDYNTSYYTMYGKGRVYNSTFGVVIPNPNPRAIDDGRQEQAWVGTRYPLSSNDSSGHTLNIEWFINDTLTFKSISGYREFTEASFANDSGSQAVQPAGGGAFLAGITASSLTEADQWSQEFQLIGETDTIDWQVGVLYFHEDGYYQDYTAFTLRYPTLASAPVPFALNTPIARKLNVDTDSYGAYAQATWTPEILDSRLHLTAGAHYSNDDKFVERNFPDGLTTNPKESRFDPAVTVAYDFLDELSGYLRWGTAYRGGGVGMREAVTFTPFESEEMATTEIGFKAQFWDNRARINGAWFYSEIDNLQQNFQQSCTGCTASNSVYTNLEERAELSGAELDASVLLVEGLTLSVAYTYLDDDLPSAVNPSSGLSENLVRGQAPSNAWSVNIDYEFAPFSFGTLALHADITDSSEYCFSTSFCEDETLPDGSNRVGVKGGEDNQLIGARATLSEIHLGNAGTLQVALWGKNLTDAEPIVFGFGVPGANNTIAVYGEPRSYGATVVYEY